MLQTKENKKINHKFAALGWWRSPVAHPAWSGMGALRMEYKTYILWSEGLQKFYAGSTSNLEERIKEHNSKSGKFTSKGAPWQLIWSFEAVNRAEAYRLEMKIKKRRIKRFLEDNNLNSGGGAAR